MNLNRRHLIQSASALTVGLAAGRAFGADAKALTFLATGDWGQKGNNFQHEIGATMGDAASRIGSQFVVAVGDNFYDAGVESVTDDHWKISYEDVYRAPSLHKPWYAIMGNHDYGGSPQAQIDYSQTSSRWIMPSRYYKRSATTPDGTAVDLFLTDTTPMNTSYHKGEADSRAKINCRYEDPAIQMRWLDSALASSTAPWKLAFGHHPIYSGGEHGDGKDLIANLLPIFQKHGVQMYVFGHDHDLQHIDNGGLHHIGTGAGASTRKAGSTTGTRFTSDTAGFTTYSVTADKLIVDFIAHDGKTLHSAQIDRVRA